MSNTGGSSVVQEEKLQHDVLNSSFFLHFCFVFLLKLKLFAPFKRTLSRNRLILPVCMGKFRPLREPIRMLRFSADQFSYIIITFMKRSFSNTSKIGKR